MKDLFNKLKKHVCSRYFWKEGTGSFILAILIALTVRWAFLEAYVIPSGSMLPSLLIRDHIFVNKLVYGMRFPFTEKWIFELEKPKRGDIVVFKYPEDMSIFYIKRIVGLPGDVIRYENGNLYVNEKVIEKKFPSEKLKKDFNWLRDEDFREGYNALSFYSHFEEKLEENTSYSVLLKKNRSTYFLTKEFGPYTVPERSYFVLGDNRDNSQDSRFWKSTHFVSKDNFIGKAFIVWLSCEKTLSFLPFLCDPRYLRWKRFFHRVHN